MAFSTLTDLGIKSPFKEKYDNFIGGKWVKPVDGKYFENITESFHLTNGTLIYMNDSIQKEWLHSIPKSDTQSGRISLTFRKLIR